MKTTTQKPQHNKTQFQGFTISAFCFSTPVAGFPFDGSDKKPRYKFRVKIALPDASQVSFNFYGSQHDFQNKKNYMDESDLLTAFDCFISDARAGGETFEIFCSEFGYQTDSIRALRTFRACQKSAEKVKKLNLNENAICNLQNALQERI